MSTYKTTTLVTKEYRPPTHASVGLERDTPYRVGRHLGGLCVSPHMASSFSLTFFFGMAFSTNVVLWRKWWHVWPGPWAEATIRCRGFGSVRSPKMSRRSRSKKEVREISMDDVMVVPVPVLHTRQHATGPKWIKNLLAAAPHMRVATGSSIDDWRISEVGHLAAKQNTRVTR